MLSVQDWTWRYNTMKNYHDFMFFSTVCCSFEGFKCGTQKLEDPKKQLKVCKKQRKTCKTQKHSYKICQYRITGFGQISKIKKIQEEHLCINFESTPPLSSPSWNTSLSLLIMFQFFLFFTQATRPCLVIQLYNTYIPSQLSDQQAS